MTAANCCSLSGNSRPHERLQRQAGVRISTRHDSTVPAPLAGQIAWKPQWSQCVPARAGNSSERTGGRPPSAGPRSACGPRRRAAAGPGPAPSPTRARPCGAGPARRRPARPGGRAGRRRRRARPRAGRARAAGCSGAPSRSGGYFVVLRSTTTTRPSSSSSSRSAYPSSADLLTVGQRHLGPELLLGGQHGAGAGAAVPVDEPGQRRLAPRRAPWPADQGVRNGICPQTLSTCAISAGTASGRRRSPLTTRSARAWTTRPKPCDAEARGLAAGLALEEPLGRAGEQRLERAGRHA